jgi:3alpha(or 20beta)-hydroxysteroid dehydrogenase
MGRLDGKVAIITGAAQGTGELGRAVAREIGVAARFVELDVRDEASWAAAVATAVDEFGGVDVLVNNAAVLLLAGIDTTTRADFLRLVEVNQLGPYLGIKAVLDPMRARGGGSIVNIVSTDGVKGMNGVSAYASTKWALRGITKSAAVELGRYRIRVNAVCPEAGNPNMSSEFIPGNPDLTDVPHQLMQQILRAPEGARPASRLDDVAAMALFLASDESMSCTGGDFVVDAGLTVGRYQKGLPSA